MSKNKRKISYLYGILSEISAIILLTIKGYVILKRRFRTKVGEVDIIAKKTNLLSFIEVKARNNKENLDNVLTFAQIFRIKQASKLYLTKNPKYYNYNISFDLIKVHSLFRITHEKNIL